MDTVRVSLSEGTSDFFTHIIQGYLTGDGSVIPLLINPLSHWSPEI